MNAAKQNNIEISKMKSYFDFEATTFWNHVIWNLRPKSDWMFRRVSVEGDPKRVYHNISSSGQKVFINKEGQQKSGLIDKENNSVGTRHFERCKFAKSILFL